MAATAPKERRREGPAGCLPAFVSFYQETNYLFQKHASSFPQVSVKRLGNLSICKTLGLFARQVGSPSKWIGILAMFSSIMI